MNLTRGLARVLIQNIIVAVPFVAEIEFVDTRQSSELEVSVTDYITPDSWSLIKQTRETRAD